MHMTINTIGTRGDVQPYVALARGLQQAGHSVRLCTLRTFEELAAQHELDTVFIEADVRAMVQQSAPNELGNNPLRLMAWYQERYREGTEELFRKGYEAAQGADLLVTSPLSAQSYHVGEKLGLPVITASLQPALPTRAFHGFGAPAPPSWLPGKGLYNYYSCKLYYVMFLGMLHRFVNENRARVLDLPPQPIRTYWDIGVDTADVVCGYSPTVIPRPPDWGVRQCVAGYWFLDDDAWQQPADLLAFLEAGPPPVYVGFGSTVEREAAEVNQLIIEALDRAGQRGVLASGWSAIGDSALPDSIYHLDYAAHEWLFPKMAAVVHHGGAGTTGAGLRAGVPNIVVPFYADQPFWAWRVEQLGAGPQAIPRKKLTAENLAHAIRLAVEHEPMRSRAANVGAKIRSEDGVGRAVQFIEQFAA